MNILTAFCCVVAFCTLVSLAARFFRPEESL